jgi:hypothetical protein
MEEFYQVATEAEQETEPDVREELLDAADEYLELIQLLQT